MTLKKAGFQLELPPEEATQQLVSDAKNRLLEKSIDRLILPYQSMLASNPADHRALLQIAILYSRYGLYDEALQSFDELQELAPPKQCAFRQ